MGLQTGEIAVVTYGRIFSFAAETAELLGNLGYPVKLVKLNHRPRWIKEGSSTGGAPVVNGFFFFEEGVGKKG